MSIDPLISLSFAIQSNKGVYAVLLGSGISRSAGIPTGWEVVQDFCRKLAQASNEAPGDDPAAWYSAKYKIEPSYSDLLAQLATTAAERQNLLRSYFEPTVEEAEQGTKRPTLAHRAIASLVASGHIRVILTTNFDRLMESALYEAGVQPTVISSPDAIAGATPLAHQRACLIKLHGDYLDSRIRNTSGELESYEPVTNALLDQVLDEFGLVICGWSGEWDTALRAAIARCPTRRFGTFFTKKGELAGAASQILINRAAVIVPIADADSFWTRLQALVFSLESSNRSHPITLQALGGLCKRYIGDPHRTIDLSDLIHDETEKARQRLEEAAKDILSGATKSIGDRLAQIESAIDRVQTVLTQAGAWGPPNTVPLSIRSLERLSARFEAAGAAAPPYCQAYPAAILLYSFGLAAIAQDQLSVLHDLIYGARLRDDSGRAKPLIQTLPWFELDNLIGKLYYHPDKRLHTPRSEHLFKLLREPLRRFLPDDQAYDEAFDLLELLNAVAFLDVDEENTKLFGPAFPPGRFCWKGRHYGRSPVAEAIAQVNRFGGGWPPLRATYCGGNVQLMLKSLGAIREICQSNFF